MSVKQIKVFIFPPRHWECILAAVLAAARSGDHFKSGWLIGGFTFLTHCPPPVTTMLNYDPNIHYTNTGPGRVLGFIRASINNLCFKCLWNYYIVNRFCCNLHDLCETQCILNFLVLLKCQSEILDYLHHDSCVLRKLPVVWRQEQAAEDKTVTIKPLHIEQLS